MEITKRLGTVIVPVEDVTELGGPSGHEMCRWKLELPSGEVLGCLKTAGHHRLERKPMRSHADHSAEVAWDELGRSWGI